MESINSFNTFIGVILVYGARSKAFWQGQVNIYTYIYITKDPPHRIRSWVSLLRCLHTSKTMTGQSTNHCYMFHHWYELRVWNEAQSSSINLQGTVWRTTGWTLYCPLYLYILSWFLSGRSKFRARICGAQESIPSLAGRYDNPICRTGPIPQIRFQGSIDVYKYRLWNEHKWWTFALYINCTSWCGSFSQNIESANPAQLS
jgi:hypothetical protein